MTYRLIPFNQEYIQEFYEEYNKDITKYMHIESFNSYKEVQEYFESINIFDEQGYTLHYLVLFKDKFIGALSIIDIEDDYPEIGIWIKKSEQKKGHGYNVLKLLLEKLNTLYPREYYKYCVDIHNIPSLALLKKFKYQYGYHDTIITETKKLLETDIYLINLK